MSNTIPPKRDNWPIEDSLAITQLARARAEVFSDIILPSGYRLAPDEANQLIASYSDKPEGS